MNVRHPTLSNDVTYNVTSPGPVTQNSNWTEAPEGCLVFQFSTYSPWNNPEDLVSHDTNQKVKLFVDVYMLSIFFLLSVPSNIVNMVVFWRHGIKERINLCLFFLSLADFIIVFSHFEWKMDRLYSALTNTPYNPVVLKLNINNMIHTLAGFIYVSGFMSTLIAFERCLCVVSPLKAQRIIQTKTTAVIIAIGHVLILAGHHVIATRWSVVCMFDPSLGQTVEMVYSSDFYMENKKLVDVFEGVIFGVILPGFFVTAVSASTVVIIARLRMMSKWRDQSASVNSSSPKDINLTRMLVGTNVLFVVCTTPPLVFHAAIPLVPDLSLNGKYYNTYQVLISLQQLLAAGNSSVNFFVYYFYGSKFRTTVRGMFCGACQKDDGRKTALAGVSQGTVVSTVS